MAKVLHVLYSQEYSGAENVVLQIIKYYSENYREYQMVYISRDGGIRNVLEKEKVTYELVSHLSLRKIRELARKYQADIIHAHDFRASFICSQVKSTAMIAHFHNNPLWLQKKGIYSQLFRVSVKKAEAVFLVSDAIEKEYVYRSLLKGKTQVIGNPVDIHRVRYLANCVNDPVGYDVLFCGRLTEQKNPVEFVRIIAELKKDIPDIRAAMCGAGELEEQVRQEIVSLGIIDHIDVLGFLENPYGIMKFSKILCLPSRWEGYGLVAVEAIALSTIPVVSMVGGLPSIVNENCGKCCQTKNEFVEEIELLLTNEDYYEAKRTECRFRAKELDNQKEYMKKLHMTYSNILRQKGKEK